VEKLIEKSLQGVKIHILIDALGGNGISNTDIEKRLTTSGVHVEYFNWLTPWRGRSKRLWYFRNHKRALIIDNTVVHLGGWCIGDKTSEWIDCHIENRDTEVVQDAVADFWNMYTYAHKSQFKFSHQKKYVFTGKRFSYAYQAPLLRSRYTYYTHKKLTQNASDKIILVTPYFAPIHGLLTQIRNAAKRGVQVELILPKKTDHVIVDLAVRTYILNLLDIGVQIYHSDTMIHAKANLFDSTLYIGTMNLDTVSLRYNFENGLYVKDEETVKDFLHDVEILKSNCTLVTLADWKSRSAWNRFFDIAMKILRPFV
jgi:cardiolipin synthase